MSYERDAAHEADDAILRFEVARVRRDLVNPVQAPAKRDQPVSDAPANRRTAVSVELADGVARIHLTHALVGEAERQTGR